MGDPIMNLFDSLLFFLFIGLIIVLVIYILESLLINGLHKLMYGKGTILAWLPFTNVYLLGKLTVNTTVGWLLVVITILTSDFVYRLGFMFGEVFASYTLLLMAYIGPFLTILRVASLGFWIYAVIKYFKLKDEKKNANNVAVAPVIVNDNVPLQQTQQPVQSQPVAQAVTTQVAQTPVVPTATPGVGVPPVVDQSVNPVVNDNSNPNNL